MTREEQRIEEAKNRFSDDQIYPISKIYAFVEGAKWADETIIDKACEWLDNNKDNYIIDIEGETLVDDQIIKDFRNAMEE